MEEETESGPIRLDLADWKARVRELEPSARARELDSAFIRITGTRQPDPHADGECAGRRAERPSEVEVGHPLFLRLFAEFANALETLAAWGWTIRNRNKFRLFLDGFLSYPTGATIGFYSDTRKHDGDLISLLRLPDKPLILAATEAGFTGWNKEECEESLGGAYFNLKQAADQYFAGEMIIVANYNKAKHGAPMVRDPASDEPREFLVLAPHLNLAASDDFQRYDQSRFRVDSANDQEGEWKHRGSQCDDPRPSLRLGIDGWSASRNRGRHKLPSRRARYHCSHRAGTNGWHG